jgi:hypothetical protein
MVFGQVSPTGYEGLGGAYRGVKNRSRDCSICLGQLVEQLANLSRG